MNIEIDFDYKKFKSLLLGASRSAFVNVQLEHPNETFYMFSLSSSAEHNGIYWGASTEEELLRYANKLLAQEEGNKNFYTGFSLENMRSLLRFGDFYPEPFSSLDSVFSEVRQCTEQWHTAIWWVLWRKMSNGEMTENEWNQIHDFHAEEFDSVCEDVLRTLDDEGVFGQGQRRQKVWLTYVYGPEAGYEVFYLGGICLNPPEVEARVKAEFVEAKRLNSIFQQNQTTHYLERKRKSLK